MPRYPPCGCWPRGCTWGRASHGHDGQNGGDGKPGAAGGRVRLEVPEAASLESIQVVAVVAVIHFTFVLSAIGISFAERLTRDGH